MLLAPDSPTSTIPNYRLIAPIGQGAYGTVYLAEDLVGVRRAVKVLPKRVLDTRVDPVKELAGIRAYQHTARGHPALIQILHVGETPECYYYAMELADPLDGLPSALRSAAAGADHPAAVRVEDPSATTPPTASRVPDASGGWPASPHQSTAAPSSSATTASGTSPVAAADAYRPLTLKSLIEREAPLPPARALAILAELLGGLAHLHSRGLIHRDVKPSNILFVDGRPKLGDLGLVTSTDRDATQLGTPGYMPPDTRIDVTADLYAAGVVLYEMVTGLHRERFPELADHRYTSRRELRDFRTARLVFNRAAHPDRRMRYGSAEDMLRDLERPVWRIRGRTHALRLTAIVVLLILVGMAGRSYWTTINAPATPAPSFRDAAIVPDAGQRKTVIRLDYDDGSTRLVHQRSLVQDLAVADLDGSGHPLVYFGVAPKPGRMGTLLAIDPAAHRTNPEAGYCFQYDLGDKPPSHWLKKRPETHGVAVPHLADDLDGDGRDELVVAAWYDSGICQLIVFTTGGRRLGQYWHFGWTEDKKGSWQPILAADLDGDGKKELIFLARANEQSLDDDRRREIYHSCLFVLDLAQLERGDGYWSIEAWMNEGSPSPPRAYGYVKHRWWGQSEEWRATQLQPVCGPGWHRFRIWFSSVVWIELNPDLMPAEEYLAINDPSLAPFTEPPRTDEVWVRMDTSRPPPGAAKDLPPGAKDPPPSGQ